MAEEQIVTRIVATSDFSNLIGDLNKVSTALTNLQSKLNATNKNLASQVAIMNRSFAETLRSTGQFSTHFVNLSSDVDKFGQQLDKGQIKLRQFFQIYQGHLKTNGGLVRQLAQQQVQLQNAILQPLGKNAEGLMQYNVHIPTGLDKVKSKTALAKQELQIMNRVIQEGANSLINWGKNTQWAGRQLTVGLTVPLAAFGKASADAFRAADQELVRLTKVYGGIAATSAQELGKVRADVTKTSSELAKAYGVSFKDTIALAADIAATGKQGNELLGSIKETTRLSVLGEVDRQDAMKATLAIQTAFKQNTEQLSESINFLNAVENQTSTTLNDLVEAIPKAGPVVKGLGGDVKDLALYLTAMREGGVSASEGANALKSALASLINPTKVATNMFAGFGIDLKGIVTQNAGDLTKTILNLQSALDTLNPLQKQQALEQLFGKFQFARMNALFENLGRQGSQTLQVLDLMKASSQDLANVAGRELAQVTESASGKYRRALEGLKADLAGVGEQFLSINTSLINIVDGILKFVNKLPGPVKTILSFFGGLTAVAGPLIMLTGVLGNFFGYIIKGASHFRSLFKGGEGWKLLTPEILAANKAGSIAETTFYSDAKAADILNQAITRLSASYTKLAADANNAIIATNPSMSTVAGTPIILNKGERVADPSNPRIGKIDTRAAAHGRPLGLMSRSERSAQTIHSVTPNPIMVNQAIGKNPQIFTYQDLPSIPGLTVQGGVSTGIVAGEAAKWHSLMAALSMQTKQEVATLNKEIATTGLVSQEFLSTYSTILPKITQVIDNAVLESQAIVRQTLAGKLRVDEARAEIIRINAQLETAMAQTTAMTAQEMGRTASLTQVPLTNQPIVDTKGKSNLREIFRDNRKPKRMLDAIARALGVKTWGGGYSIETTRPKKFAEGGTVVGGPRSDTTDTQFAYLNEGDFVLNRKASDALLGFSQGGEVPAMVTPGEIVIHKPTPEEVDILSAYNNQYAVGGKVNRSKNNYGIRVAGRGATRNKTAQQIQAQRIASGRGRDRDTSQLVSIGDQAVLVRGQAAKRSLELSLASLPADKQQQAMGYLQNYASSITAATHNKAKTIQAKDLPEIEKNWVWGQFNKTGASTNATHATKAFIDESGNRWVSQYTYDYDWYSNQLLKTGLPVKDLISMNSKLSGKYNNLFKKLEIPSNQWPILEKRIDNRLDMKYGNSSRMISDDLQGTLTVQDHISPIVDGVIMQSFGLSDTARMIARRKLKELKKPTVLRSRAKDQTGSIVSGFNSGGVVGGRVRRGKNNYGMPSMMSNIGQNVGYMGSMFAGSAIGGKLGGNLGSIAGSVLAPAIFSSVLQKITAVNQAGNAATGIFTRLGPLLANPYVLAGAAIVGVTAGIMKLKAKMEETARINRLAFSGGVKPIKDFDSELKQAIKSIENTKAAAELLHAQMNSAGLTGLTLTIKQFADLRENIKSTYPELIKLFNQTPTDKLTTVAQGLKAQFVAAGDSAAQANAKIAALLAETGKTGFIQVVLGDKGLSQITDAKSAIQSMLNAIAKFKDDKDKAAGILQVFSSFSDYIGTAKDKSAALKDQFDAIAKSQNENVKLTENQILEISKTNPKLAEILSTSDDIGTTLAKWRLAVAGVTKDVSGLDRNQLQKLAISVEAVTARYNELLDVSSKAAQSNSFTGKMAKDIDAFNKAQANANKSAIQNIQTQIDLKNKQIDQIKKEGEARKKALRDQQQIEDIKLQIQQEQLNYQMALAAGDMSSAAQAQINIQRLVGQQQLKSAEDAIDAAVQAKIDALQAQIDVLNKKGTTLSNAASTATPKESPLTSIYQGITTLQKDYALGNISEEDALTRLNDLVMKLEKTPGGKKYLPDLGVKGSVNTLTREDGAITKSKIDTSTAGGAALLAALDKGRNEIAQKQLTVLQEILGVLKNQPGKTYTPTSSQVQNAGATTAAGGTFAVGTIKNYTSSSSSIKSAALAASQDRNTGHATVGNKTFKLFKYGDKSYGVETSSGSVYEWNTNTNTIGKDLIGNVTGRNSFSSGGFVRRYSTAGFVSGPGTGTSDSIPAMLSNGEYVIRAASVQAVGTSFLDGINKMSAGGIATKYSIPRMSMGGKINMSNAGSASTSNSLYNINVTLNGSDLSPDDVARAIENRMRMAQIKQGRDRIIA